MSKKNLIIIISVVFIAIFGALIYWFFYQTKTTGTQTSIPAGNNPFGGGGNTKPISTSTNQGTSSTSISGEIKKPAYFQIYKNPVAGFSFADTKSKKNALVFTDRASGNTYEYLADLGTGIPVRISNTTVPKIYEALWSSLGDQAILRYLSNENDTVTTLFAKLRSNPNDTSSISELTTKNLTADIKEITMNPAGNRIFSLLKKPEGGSYGIISDINGDNKKQVFDSPLNLWNISWSAPNIITFVTKGVYKELGYVFFYNLDNGSFEKVFGGINGLSAIANNNSSILAFSGNPDGATKPGLNFYDVKKKTFMNFLIETLADKCAWGVKNNKIIYCAVPKNLPAGNYPDSWYQGLLSFSDNIWRINTETGETKVLLDPSLKEETLFDVMSMKISADDNFLSFVDKKDLSLWLLDLSRTIDLGVGD